MAVNSEGIQAAEEAEHKFHHSCYDNPTAEVFCEL